MGFGDAYMTVAEFRERTKQNVSGSDDAIAAVLLAASRQVDLFCAREFNKSQLPETRIVTWPHVGDIVDVSTVASDNGSGLYQTLWDVDTYNLAPRNAVVKGFPYTEIQTTRYNRFPYSELIQIVGIFGWPSVPSPVKEATFMIANRLKSLWDAPFGQSGGGEMGGLNMTTATTPIIEQMLRPYRVRTV